VLHCRAGRPPQLLLLDLLEWIAEVCQTFLAHPLELRLPFHVEVARLHGGNAIRGQSHDIERTCFGFHEWRDHVSFYPRKVVWTANIQRRSTALCNAGEASNEELSGPRGCAHGNPHYGKPSARVLGRLADYT